MIDKRFGRRVLNWLHVGGGVRGAYFASAFCPELFGAPTRREERPPPRVLRKNSFFLVASFVPPERYPTGGINSGAPCQTRRPNSKLLGAQSPWRQWEMQTGGNPARTFIVGGGGGGGGFQPAALETPQPTDEFPLVSGAERFFGREFFAGNPVEKRELPRYPKDGAPRHARKDTMPSLVHRARWRTKEFGFRPRRNYNFPPSIQQGVLVHFVDAF